MLIMWSFLVPNIIYDSHNRALEVTLAIYLLALLILNMALIPLVLHFA